MSAKRDDEHRPPTIADVAEQLAAKRKRLSGIDAERLLSVQDQMAAVARGDFNAVLRQAHPDIELEMYTPAAFGFTPRTRGLEAVRAAIERNFSLVADQRPVLTNILTQEDVVVLFGTEAGRIRATGKPYHVQFVHRFTFEGTALKNIRIIGADIV